MLSRLNSSISFMSRVNDFLSVVENSSFPVRRGFYTYKSSAIENLNLVEMKELEDSIEYYIKLPGFNKDTVKIDWDKQLNVVRISANKESNSKEFKIYLGNVIPKEIESTMVDGILTVTSKFKEPLSEVESIKIK